MRNTFMVLMLLMLFSCSEKAGTKLGDYISYVNVKKHYTDWKLRLEDEKQQKIRDYNQYCMTEFDEYKHVMAWFKTNPPQVVDLSGKIYKITGSLIKNGNDIKRADFRGKTIEGTYKYFFKSEVGFFIYDLQIVDGDVRCLNVRRIGTGWAKEPVYDLIYDEKGLLLEEIYQGDVNPEFFVRDEESYFSFKKKVNGKKIVNTICLGRSF